MAPHGTCPPSKRRKLLILLSKITFKHGPTWFIYRPLWLNGLIILNKIKIIRPIVRHFQNGAQNRPIKSSAFRLANFRINWADRPCVQYRGTVVLSGHAGRLRSIGAMGFRSVAGFAGDRLGPCRHCMTCYQNGATCGRVTCYGADFGHCVGLIKMAVEHQENGARLVNIRTKENRPIKAGLFVFN